jgi:MutS domain V
VLIPSSPREEYSGRLARRRAVHQRLSELDRSYSFARLTVFGITAIVAWLIIRAVSTSGHWQAMLGTAMWLILPVAAFLVLVVRHDHVISQRDLSSRAIAFYERGLARIDDRWIGTGDPGERFHDDDHLYANDLDLFGRGSLFELLSIARTRAGEETIAAWLKQPASIETVLARQEAVEELTWQLDLRESLAMAGTDVRAGVHTEALIQWASAPEALRHASLRVVAFVLSGATLLAAILWGMTNEPGPFLAMAALEFLFFLPLRGRVLHVLHAAEQPARDLDVLAHLLERLEAETFQSARLTALRASLETGGMPASRAIRQLHRLSECHAWQHNQVFGPVAAAVLWGTHLAFAIESWRRRHGGHVAGWLAVVGEFEAFSSLSAYKYEHPNDPFPNVIEAERAAFEAEALGHPLVPAARLVRNDVHLTGDVGLLVVSGSNMSGKSTLLRTVGINTVLSLMGAPVRARRLRLTPLAVGATLRIQDSLQEGRSRFYAEITRLRRLVDVANGPVPLLFLLDELFHGTNSHDRVVGATGVLRSLLDRAAIGLITTHDLALTRVAEDLQPRAANVHFEDRFEGGEIQFDYRLRPGPVTRSNALALMKAVGLRLD